MENRVTLIVFAKTWSYMYNHRYSLGISWHDHGRIMVPPGPEAWKRLLAPRKIYAIFSYLPYFSSVILCS